MDPPLLMKTEHTIEYFCGRWPTTRSSFQTFTVSGVPYVLVNIITANSFISPRCLPLYVHVLKLDSAAHLQLVSPKAATCLVLLGKTTFSSFVTPMHAIGKEGLIFVC